MATKVLDEARLRALHQAALVAGLAPQRADLLRGLDASFVASLPVSSSQSAQLFTDLHELSVVLRDGSVPIVTWLKNAVTLAGGRAEVEVFEEALAHLGHAAPPRAVAPPSKAGTRSAPREAGERIDVVILAALQDELDAVLALGEGGREGWEEKRDLQRFRYFRRRFARESGRDLVIAAAWIGEMGERAATSRGQQLVQELSPVCLAMCGICAGWRKKLALGDIVVADRLYSYDHGKIVVAAGGEEELFHDIATFSLEKTWKMDAAFLARAIPLGALAEERPPSRAAQRRWLLDALYAHEKERAPPPEERAEWAKACPDHAEVLAALDADQLVDLDAETLALIESGHKVVRKERRLYPKGRAIDPALRIKVGALATGKTVRLWDATTGHERRAISGHTENVSSMAFSPDGRMLASSSDKTVRLWDVETGREIHALSGNTRGGVSIAFSPDGRILALGSKDRRIRLWDAVTGHELRALSGHTLGVLSVAFSPDGQSIISGSADAQIRLWDVATGAELHVLSRHTARVGSVVFSPDGRSIASGSKDKTVRLWNAATWHELRVLSGHTDSVASVAFSPDGLWLASGSADKRVLLWDAATGQLQRPLSGHTDSVLSVAFSPDGRSLASSSDDGTIRLWDVASGHCLAVLLSTLEGWVSYVPEAYPGGPPRGAFKMGGDLAGSFWHVIGLARFEPGELDEFLPEGQKLRLPDDHVFLPPAPPAAGRPRALR